MQRSVCAETSRIVVNGEGQRLDVKDGSREELKETDGPLEKIKEQTWINIK